MIISTPANQNHVWFSALLQTSSSSDIADHEIQATDLDNQLPLSERVFSEHIEYSETHLIFSNAFILGYLKHPELNIFIPYRKLAGHFKLPLSANTSLMHRLEWMNRSLEDAQLEMQELANDPSPIPLSAFEHEFPLKYLFPSPSQTQETPKTQFDSPPPQ